MTQTFEIVSPVDGRKLFTRSYAKSADVECAVLSAKKAFPVWRHTPLAVRTAYIRAFVRALEERRDELADLVSWQMGRPRWQADELPRLRLNAERMIEIANEALVPMYAGGDDGVRRFMEPEPLGVCLSICAWNYPVAMASSLIFTPLLAGNTVIFKHAPQTAVIADIFNEAFREIGMPEGVFQALDITHGDAEAMVGSGNVQLLQFIGSNRGGQAVAKAARSSFIKLGLELGGKDPAYIRSDIAVEEIVDDFVEGCFGNAGQSCCSVERIYVHRDRYEDFLEAFAEATRRQVSIGHPFDEKTFIGPVVSSQAAARIRQVIDEAQRGGARALLSVPDISLGPAYVTPQILADANQGSALMQEESFGPLVGVMPVSSDEEAIALMNDSDYGLTASIWTRDVERGLQLGRAVESGTFYVNRCDHADPNLTWGGVKQSGIGRSYGAPGFEDVTAWRSYHLRRLDTV